MKGHQFDSLVGAYSDPIEESSKIKDLIAFRTDKDKALEIFVDGVKAS